MKAASRRHGTNLYLLVFDGVVVSEILGFRGSVSRRERTGGRDGGLDGDVGAGGDAEAQQRRRAEDAGARNA